jgi:hypothetical protein
MVVLQESPHPAEHGKIGDLDFRQLLQRDPRATVEFLVEIDDGLGRFHARHVRDRFAVDQQSQIVRPHPPGAHGEDPEHQPFRRLVERKRDGVFRPFGRAFELTRLHVLQRQHPAVIVLPHPQTGVIRDVRRAQEAAQLELCAHEIDRDRLRNGRERARTGVVPLDPQRPAAAVHDLVVDGERARRRAGPILRDATDVVRLEVQQAGKLRTPGRRLRRGALPRQRQQQQTR